MVFHNRGTSWNVLPTDMVVHLYWHFYLDMSTYSSKPVEVSSYTHGKLIISLLWGAPTLAVLWFDICMHFHVVIVCVCWCHAFIQGNVYCHRVRRLLNTGCLCVCLLMAAILY